jgi:hypothetical protein
MNDPCLYFGLKKIFLSRIGLFWHDLAQWVGQYPYQLPYNFTGKSKKKPSSQLEGFYGFEFRRCAFIFRRGDLTACLGKNRRHSGKNFRR